MRAWVEIEASVKDGLTTVLVDPDDYLSWVDFGRKSLSVGSHGYAQMWRGRTCVLLHRWVLGLHPGDGLIGDHRNADRMDNRRTNLRAVTPSGSSQNVAGRGQSRYRGVHPMRSGRWGAQVKFQGVTHYLGTYATEDEAARVAEAKRAELMPFYVPATERVA